MDDHHSSLSGDSSPVSLLSRSPSLVPAFDMFSGSQAPIPIPTLHNYPSPALSSELSSLGSSPSPPDMALHTPRSSQSEDDSPPKKRRRLNDNKERSSMSLDLSNGLVCENEKEQLDKLMKVLHKRRKIVVIAGAGISVSAGIPDFRSSTGLFKTLKREHNLKSSGKDLFDAAVYKDGDSTTSFHAMVRNLSTATKTANATPFHHLLATLAKEERLLRLYTQNVDGIDTSLPPLKTEVPLPRKGPWPKTVQLHGTLEHMTCTKCHQITELNPDLFDGPSPPPCKHCEESDGIRTQHAGKRSHGIGVLRPRMVLYNEHNPDDEAIGAVVKADMRTRPDALIVVGTTLKVPGVKRIVKEMCGIVRDRKDGVTVWINNDPPPALKDYEWDLVVQGPCDQVAAHAAMRKWYEPEPKLEPVSEEQIAKVKREQMAEVVITSPMKNRTVDRINGLSTPAASPKMKPAAPILMPKADSATGAAKKQTILAGTKRKGESKPSAAQKKPQATRKTAPKKRESKKNQKPQSSGIKLNFGVSKYSQPNLAPIKPAGKESALEIATILSRPRVEPILFSDPVLQPLSPGNFRNNPSPPLVSRKSYGDLKINTSSPGWETREERQRTVSPSSKPKGMDNLIS